MVGATDLSKTVFFLLDVDDQLISHEEFKRLLHPIDCTTVQSITCAIEDILLETFIAARDCCGKCYDGASSMTVCKTGLVTTVLALEQ